MLKLSAGFDLRRHWRQNPLPGALRTVGEGKGIHWGTSIVVNLKIDFPGMPQLFGLLVTQDERFVSFELTTDATHEVIGKVCKTRSTASAELAVRSGAVHWATGDLARREAHVSVQDHLPARAFAQARCNSGSVLASSTCRICWHSV